MISRGYSLAYSATTLVPTSTQSISADQPSKCDALCLASVLFATLIFIASPAWGAALSADGNQLWHLDTPGIPGTADSSYEWGEHVAVGDFNGDGHDDLLVAGPYVSSYKVYVFYGTTTGLDPATVEVFEPSGDGPYTVGDFNNDGKDDLAVGDTHRSVRKCVWIPSDTGSPIYIDARGCSNGAVDIYYGSANGLPSTRDETWHQDKSGIKSSAEGFDHFGNSLASGDFDGDGYDDLAVGIADEDLAGTCEYGIDLDVICNAGAVQILYGSSGGISARDQLWHQDKDGLKGVAEKGDHFGASLAAGDFDGDGRDDLAIGIPYENMGTCTLFDKDGCEVGVVQILYGGSSGLTTRDQIWHQDVSGVKGKAQKYDRFGQVLATGDFDGDGHDDLAVRVSDGIGGAVQVFYGAGSGLTSRDQIWHQDVSGIKGESERGDDFGRALASGDFDYNGTDDLAIGVPGEGLGNCPHPVLGTASECSDAGAVQVLYSDADGLSSRDQLWHQDRPGVQGGVEAGDRFGSTFAVGNFNGHFQMDLVIGVPDEDIGDASAAGAIQLLYGAGGTLPPDADAGRNWFVVAGPGGTAEVNLDGSGSSDPEGEMLSFAWTWADGSATGVTPTVTLPIGRHTITLTVSDESEGVDSDTTIVQVYESDPLVPGAPLVFHEQPAESTSGELLDPQPVVWATDAEGNPALTFNGPVTVELVDDMGCGGTLSGALTINAINGVAAFRDLGVDGACTNYVIRATSPDLSPAETEPFGILPVGMSLAVNAWTEPVSMCAPGGNFGVMVRVANAMGRDATLETLVDSTWGDLGEVCELPLSIGAGDFFQCSFTRSAMGVGSGTESHTITAGFNKPFPDASDTLEISVHALPEPVIVPGSESSVCAGSTLTLDAGEEFDSYLWSTGQTTQTISVVEAGAYTVTVTDSNDCSATSAATTVTVNPLPTPVITPVQELPQCPETPVTLDAGAGYSAYDWSNGDTTQATTVTGAATYSVQVTDGNGCQASDTFDLLTKSPEPDFEASVTEMELVVDQPGGLATGTVTVTNVNCGVMRTSASLTLGPPFSITENTCTDLDIGPDENCQVTVGFAPYRSRTFNSELVLLNENEPDEPEVRILLRGLGINVGIPTLSMGGLLLLSLILSGIAYRRLHAPARTATDNHATNR